MGVYLEQKGVESVSSSSTSSFAENQLELELYRNLVSSTSDYICIIDPRYQYRIVNDAFCALVKRKRSEIIGKSVKEVIGEELFVKTIKPELDNCLSGKVVRFQFSAHFGNEELLSFAVTYTPYMDRGKVIGIIGNVKDVSELVRVQNELKNEVRRTTFRKRVARIFLSLPGAQAYEKALDILLEYFFCKYGFIGTLNEEGDLVCPTMSRDVWRECGIRDKSTIFPRHTWGGIWGEALRTGCSFIKNENIHTPDGHIGLENVIVTPITIQNKVVGIIVLANNEAGFTQADLTQLKKIAAMLAPAIKIRIERERDQVKLERYAAKLEKQNIALNVLLDNRELQKEKLAETIVRNFDQLVLPYLESVKRSRDPQEVADYLDLLEKNIKECLFDIDKPLATIYRQLTPSEIKVANLVKQGKSSKEIAGLLRMSLRTVYFHRNNIRKKFNLHKKQENLQTYLLSLA